MILAKWKLCQLVKKIDLRLHKCNFEGVCTGKVALSRCHFPSFMNTLKLIWLCASEERGLFSCELAKFVMKTFSTSDLN